MRIYASKTRRAGVLAVALCAASCSAPPKPTPPSLRTSRGAPPATILVRHEHVTFRASASLELHAMLAAAARNDEPLAPEFEPARAAYARVLADDEDDAFLRDPSPLANVFHRAEQHFAPEWERRSRITWAAIERASSVMDDQADGVLVSVAKDLGITWRDTANVDFVAESPPAGRKALLTPFLAARGPCFVNNTRIVDCVVVRALLSGERPPGFSERFFTILVVHAVAAVMTGIDPKHESVDRRAIAAVEPEVLAFVTAEWRPGERHEAVTPELERRAPASRASR